MKNAHLPHRAAAVAVAAVAAVVTLSALSQAAPPLPQDPPASLPDGWTGDVIVKFAPTSVANASASNREGAVKAAGRSARLPAAPQSKRELPNQAVLVNGAGDPEGLITALKARGDVVYAEPDVVVTPTATNDPFWDRSWNLQATANGISAEPAWTRSKGAGVKVAVIDTGKTDHPDMAGRWVGGYDFISNATTAADGNGRDADPTDLGDMCDPDPSSWHGTGVASNIVANENNGTGIAGVAPDAQVVPIRALGRCGGAMSDVMDAMFWASGGTVAGVPANPNPARVINLSLSSKNPSACTRYMADMIAKTKARGSLVVIAAGNSGGPASSYSPGSCPAAFTVGATTVNGIRAGYSNYGSPIDLSAPGGYYDGFIPTLSIASDTTNNGAYTVVGVMGTSTAAPHVAGVAALLLGSNKNLTVAQLETLLLKSVKPINCTDCGAGLIDAAKALNLSPQVVTYGFNGVGIEGGNFTLVGGGLAAVKSVTIGGRPATIVGTTDGSRLTVRAPAVLAPGRYALTVTTDLLTTTLPALVPYLGGPAVSGLSATSAKPGTQLQVNGSGFLPGATVTFEDLPATVVSVTPTTITVVVPQVSASTRSIIRVTTTSGTSSAAKASLFTITP